VSGSPKFRRGDALDAARGRARRRAADWRGHAAEATALALLLVKGYRPLARRFRASGGEIDLVVARGDTIAFVEVKSRASLDAAFVAIDAAKRRRFSRAVRAWLTRNPWAAGRTFRADAVFTAPGRFPRHLPAAFEIEMG
jgi:putative endonuclease